MPVRTRSQVQRLKSEDTSSGSSGSSGSSSTNVSTPNVTTTSSRRSKKTRTSSRLAKKKTEQMEVKEESEEVTPVLSQTELSDNGTGTKTGGSTYYTRNVDDMRQYVKEILNSPNKLNLPKKAPGPSPRVDRITINQNQSDQQMEFLIPPQRKDDPIEMRERIRATLSSPSDKPQRVPVQIPERSPSGSVHSSTSNTPMYNKETGMWSPNLPSYDQEHADQVSKWLIFLIFSILIAIFCGIFQHEILQFCQAQMKPMGELWEAMVSFIKNMIFQTAKTTLDTNNDVEDVNDVNNGNDINEVHDEPSAEDAQITIPK